MKYRYSDGMKKTTILAFGAMQQAEMDALENVAQVIKLWKEKDPESVLQSCRMDVQIILSTYNGMPVTAKIIESLPNLELIAQYGAGLNNIDLDTAKKRQIAVINTPDSPTKDTADTAVILMMSVMRRIVEADMFVRIGKWASSPFPLATAVNSKKVGICGFGRIGQAIAKRCAAFDMDVVYHSRTEKPQSGYTYYYNLENMARDIDVLIMACPGGNATHHIANAKIFNALGSKGYFINIARGSVVNMDDLLIALHNKNIAGAGLDVYDNEPNVPHELISMDNVVLLPHIGGGTFETRTNMGQVVVANILAHLNSDPLLSQVAV